MTEVMGSSPIVGLSLRASAEPIMRERRGSPDGSHLWRGMAPATDDLRHGRTRGEWRWQCYAGLCVTSRSPASYSLSSRTCPWRSSPRSLHPEAYGCHHGLKLVTLPVVSTAAQSEVDAQKTLVRSVPVLSSLVQLVPPLVAMKMLPVLSTAAQVELPLQAIAVRSFVPSMSCFVAVALPSDIASVRTLPAPSTAKQDVVEAQATPWSALEPSTSVAVHDDDSIWLVVSAT